MSEGDLFQVEGCPYALSRAEAEEAMETESEIGNTIALVSHGRGERWAPMFVRATKNAAVYQLDPCHSVLIRSILSTSIVQQ